MINVESNIDHLVALVMSVMDISPLPSYLTHLHTCWWDTFCFSCEYSSECYWKTMSGIGYITISHCIIPSHLHILVGDTVDKIPQRLLFMDIKCVENCALNDLIYP